MKKPTQKVHPQHRRCTKKSISAPPKSAPVVRDQAWLSNLPWVRTIAILAGQQFSVVAMEERFLRRWFTVTTDRTQEVVLRAVEAILVVAINTMLAEVHDRSTFGVAEFKYAHLNNTGSLNTWESALDVAKNLVLDHARAGGERPSRECLRERMELALCRFHEVFGLPGIQMHLAAMRRHRLGAGHAHQAGQSDVTAADAAFQLQRQFLQLGRLRQHLLAGQRWAIAVGGAVQQAHAEGSLQGSQPAPHGREGDMQLLGGGGKAAVPRQGKEEAQVVPVKHAGRPWRFRTAGAR